MKFEYDTVYTLNKTRIVEKGDVYYTMTYGIIKPEGYKYHFQGEAGDGLTLRRDSVVYYDTLEDITDNKPSGYDNVNMETGVCRNVVSLVYTEQGMEIARENIWSL